jgi:hypothetical protein
MLLSDRLEYFTVLRLSKKGEANVVVVAMA